MNGLASNYSTLDRHEEAMHLHKQTLELRKRVLGDQHPDTLQSRDNFTESYYTLG